MAPSATRLRSAWMHALASAPPPTWTTSRSTGDARGRDDLPAERLATLDGEPVQVALAGEGDARRLASASQQRVIRRIPGQPVAGQT